MPCERLAPFAAATLGRGDVIAVLGYSEHSARALAAAQRAGLEPRVLVGEMASDQSGKRLARELLAHGVQVRVTWDLALLAAVEEADHVWLGCEAAGAGRFIAHRGAALLLERARAAEVPSRGLATASDLLPGGELELPAWGARETDDLWCFAPEGVELDAQPYELVDADRVDAWTTDAGCEAFADLCVRALRSEVAPSLTAVR
ncbi:MAG: hypothetical protein H6828_05100 [Planctomycetes bacterium]|nr:hypothetical protein [Planctomycetota bacterium]